MGESPFSKPCRIILCFLVLFPGNGFAPDHNNLVYKGCADQKFQDPSGEYSQTLDTLFATLVSQSSAARFYKATAGQGQSAILGLYQCRGDLSNADCYSCVSEIPEISRKLCGNTIAARVQLSGCYLRYEVVGFRQLPETELLFKVCGSTRASGSGFQDRLDAALGQIEKGVAENGNGFYTAGYQSVYALGQCEGDLGSGDCVNCVKSAVERAKSDCGTSISAQIYLHQCYISYSYYPNGVPSKSFSSGGTGHNTQKTVAIVLGGIVGFGIAVAALLVLKSVFKKRDRGKYGG